MVISTVWLRYLASSLALPALMVSLTWPIMSEDCADALKPPITTRNTIQAKKMSLLAFILRSYDGLKLCHVRSFGGFRMKDTELFSVARGPKTVYSIFLCTLYPSQLLILRITIFAA